MTRFFCGAVLALCLSQSAFAQALGPEQSDRETALRARIVDAPQDTLRRLLYDFRILAPTGVYLLPHLS